MANSLANKTLTLTRNLNLLKSLSISVRSFNSGAAATEAVTEAPPPETSDSSEKKEQKSDEEVVMVKAPKSTTKSSIFSSDSAAMPTSSMTGSIVGKRFYKKVTVRESDDGNGWTVMLDYRTLKTPTKKPLKLPNLALAKVIAAEWEYQLADGIRPFTMPIMKLACTAMERVPLTRKTIIENLVSKFHKDLVFCRFPTEEGDDVTRAVYEKQVEKLDPLLKWVELEFGYKTVVHSTYFGGKQEDGLVKAVEDLLKNTDNSELAVIDALVSASHSIIIAIGLFRGKLQIEEAVELIRLEEDMQVGRWGLVEGGHDVDMADIRVQISCAVVYLGLSRKI